MLTYANRFTHDSKYYVIPTQRKPLCSARPHSDTKNHAKYCMMDSAIN